MNSAETAHSMYYWRIWSRDVTHDRWELNYWWKGIRGCLRKASKRWGRFHVFKIVSSALARCQESRENLRNMQGRTTTKRYLNLSPQYTILATLNWICRTSQVRSLQARMPSKNLPASSSDDRILFEVGNKMKDHRGYWALSFNQGYCEDDWMVSD